MAKINSEVSGRSVGRLGKIFPRKTPFVRKTESLSNTEGN
jgi:hypothetical protein